MSKKVMLMILDGWGHGKADNSDAIHLANTTVMDNLSQKYPTANLITFGEKVGLPEGQMGNSEVGHLNIGAGRIVYQDLVRLNKEIESKAFFNNKALVESMQYAEKNQKTLHLMGLVSDGGVHSHINHLLALISMSEQYKIPNICIHAFLDGRDTSPNGGVNYMKKLMEATNNSKVEVSSVIGRYYSMDRDKRWERIKIAYDMLKEGIGEKSDNFIEGIQKSYDNNITDEFIKPMVSTNYQGMKEGDAIICFNFRTDRCRQITTALTQEDFTEFGMQKLNLHYTTMTQYDASFKGVKVAYHKDNLVNTLGEVIANENRSQTRIAETEKYPHVTFFFSGGRETKFKNENRILINSPKVATYDLQPEMSAEEVTTSIIQEIQEKTPDFICLNFANPDMVGHTGVKEAVIKAVEKVDACVGRIFEAGLAKDYSFVIIADHGNADKVINEDGTPHTAHTTNLVPCIIINENVKECKNGILADVAPTILKLMNIKQPIEMTGNSLV